MTFYGRKRSARFHNVQIINVRFGMYFFQKIGEVSTDKSGASGDKIIHDVNDLIIDKTNFHALGKLFSCQIAAKLLYSHSLPVASSIFHL